MSQQINQTTPGMVIIGAGHCGGRAALALREMGWTGSISLIGEESILPYERPPLSKSVLTSQEEAEQLLPSLQLADAEAYANAGIAVFLDTRVELIDRATNTVVLHNGVKLVYHRLLLATGGKARSLNLPGADAGHVFTLRTFSDAKLIKAQLTPGKRVILIGGGFIGLELASSARESGCQVDVIEGAARLLGRAVPESIAAEVLALHQKHETTMSLSAQPAGILHHQDGSMTLELADGTQKQADMIIIGIGMVPCTSLARQAGLVVDQGIVVDRLLCTSDPVIFAAGDVCQFPSVTGAVTGAVTEAGNAVAQANVALIRQETWHNAETQAAVVAGNMLGAEMEYAHIPWFWSDQYDHTLQVCGEPAYGVTSVTRRLEQGGLLIFFMSADGTLVAGSGFGVASGKNGVSKDLKLVRKLVENHARIAPELLENPAYSLKKLLSEG